MPAGATSRQELRYLLEEAKRSGRPYREASRTYTRGGREKDRYGRIKDPFGFYDEQGRRLYGSILGGGSYRGHGAGNAPYDPESAPSVTTGKFDTSNSSTPSRSERGASIGTKEKARMRKRAASDPRWQFGWTGSSPLASNEERDIRQALDGVPFAPSSQERANINEVDAREARRQRIRNATRNAPVFPYLLPRPAYDLGESSNSPSMFNNYSSYGPYSL